MAQLLYSIERYKAAFLAANGRPAIVSMAKPGITHAFGRDTFYVRGTSDGEKATIACRLSALDEMIARLEKRTAR